MFAELDPIAADDAASTSPGSPRGLDPRVGLFVGNYRLTARLGEGGMAAVYRGEHRYVTGAVVAVKLLDRRLAATPGASRRFLHEAQALFELMGRNRHIPRVLDYGRTERGEGYMVMEYLRGLDLAQLLQREGPLPWPRAARLTLQLCDALAAAHARDILHRDIKPANCFLVEEEGVEIVKLIDFGVAKDLRAVADPTALGMIVGTPAYLAPEILIDGSRPSVRSDIYSLGATLYRLLANKPHVTGQTWQDIAYHLQLARILPPSAHLGPTPPLSPEVDALVLRALSRDPGQRFTSVLELADAVRACLAAAPVQRSRAGAGRTISARRVLAALSSAIGVLAVADPALVEPADGPTIEAVRPESTRGAAHVADTPSGERVASAEPQHSAPGIALNAPTDAGNGEPPATMLDPVQRRRALRRDLGSVRRAVEVCAARHGGNLVAELAVRVQVSADGVGERVALPEPSSAALLACVTRAIRSRRYTPGPAEETLGHVFRFRQG